MSRLLTRGEIIKAITGKYPGLDPEMDIDFDGIAETAKAQAELTEAETLKAVGVWLEKILKPDRLVVDAVNDIREAIEALKEGKMPK